MNSDLQITIATPLYPPDIGGPATYTHLLEHALPKRGIAVSVASFSTYRHLPKGVRHLWHAIKLFRVSKGSSVIFAQDPVSVGVPAYIVSRLRRIDLVIRMPGDYAWEQSVQRYGVTDDIDAFQTKQYGWRVQWLRRIQKFTSTHATRIVTPSEYFRQLVIGWGVAADRVTTIYNGVDFSEQPRFIEKPTGLTMVSAGRLVPWKGFDALLHVLKDLPEWTLRILGDGPDRTRLEQLAQSLGVADRVVFMGSVQHDKVLGWCKAADAFVLNTHFESFSFQVVEAMMCGVPIITTTVGSLPELITTGQEGILLEPDDVEGMKRALMSVKEEPQVWEERCDKAQAKAATFSIGNTVAKVEALLREIVKL